MPRVLGMIILLVCVGWLACRVEVRSTANSAGIEANTWRRTINGWERTADWVRPQPPADPALHPLMLAAGELLFSLFILAALPTTAILSPRPAE